MEDRIVRFAERSITATNEGGSPGSMLVDFFSFCKLSGRFHLSVIVLGMTIPRTNSEVHPYLDARCDVQEACYVGQRMPDSMA